MAEKIAYKKSVSYTFEVDGEQYAITDWDEDPTAKDIQKRFSQVSRLISYQDCEVHAGPIYKAAGWQATTIHKGGSWNRPNAQNKNGKPRTRPDKNNATGAKQRWELILSRKGRPT